MYLDTQLKELKRYLSEDTFKKVIFFEYWHDLDKKQLNIDDCLFYYEYINFLKRHPDVYKGKYKPFILENNELYEKWLAIPRNLEKYLDHPFFKKITVDQIRSIPKTQGMYSYQVFSIRSNAILIHHESGNCISPYDYIDKYKLIDGKWQLIKSYRKKY